MTEQPSGTRPSGQGSTGQGSVQEPGDRATGAAFWRERGARLRRAVSSRQARNAWTGALALAVTGSVLVTASASVPTAGPLSSGTPTGTTSDTLTGTNRQALRASGVRPDTRTTQATSHGITLGQVLAVLDRAERMMQQRDAAPSPAVAQAAGELGMLYTTYQAQQLALAEADRPLRVETAPTSGRPRTQALDTGAMSAGEVRQAVRTAQTTAAPARQVDGTRQTDGTGQTEQAAQAEQAAAKQLEAAKAAAKQMAALRAAGAEVSDAQMAAVEAAVAQATAAHEAAAGKQAAAAQADAQHEAEEQTAASKRAAAKQATAKQKAAARAATGAAEPHVAEHGTGYVTFDEVATAAMRLANMLDPSSPTALIETLPATGGSLRQSLLETVAAHSGSTTGYANGRIPADALCSLPFAPGHMLRCDAAERLTALSERFEKEFGYPIPLTDSYRSYATQIAVKGNKPHLAAIPGTSNHGWGLAIDLDNPIAGGSSAEYVWLRLHAPDYGWENPSWAQLDGEKPEPWHFEFFAAGSIPNRAIDPADVGTWTPAAQPSPGDATSPKFRQAAEHGPADTSQVTDGAGGSDDGSKPVEKPSAPARPAPAEPAPEDPARPAPTDPPEQQPDSDKDPVGAAVDDTVRAVDDTLDGTVDLVDGVVNGAVGGLLGTDTTSSKGSGVG